MLIIVYEKVVIFAIFFINDYENGSFYGTVFVPFLTYGTTFIIYYEENVNKLLTNAHNQL